MQSISEPGNQTLRQTNSYDEGTRLSMPDGNYGYDVFGSSGIGLGCQESPPVDPTSNLNDSRWSPDSSVYSSDSPSRGSSPSSSMSSFLLHLEASENPSRTSADGGDLLRLSRRTSSTSLSSFRYHDCSSDGEADVPSSTSSNEIQTSLPDFESHLSTVEPQTDELFLPSESEDNWI